MEYEKILDVLHLPKTDISQLESSVDQLYDDDIEKKIQGIQVILALSCNALFLEKNFLKEKNQIVNALYRIFAEESKKSYQLSINCFALLLLLSFAKPLHSTLNISSLLEMLVSRLEFETDRYKLRTLEHQKKGVANYEILTQKQNKIIYAALFVLFNVVEERRFLMRFLQNGDAVKTVLFFFGIKFSEIHQILWILLSRLSSAETALFELQKNKIHQILDKKLGEYLAEPSAEMAACLPSLLMFVRILASHEIFTEKLSKAFFPYAVSLLSLPSPLVRDATIQILAVLSRSHFVASKYLQNQKFTPLIQVLVAMVAAFPPNQILPPSLSDLFASIAFASNTSNILVKNSKFSSIILRAIKNSDLPLLKGVNNALLQFSETGNGNGSLSEKNLTAVLRELYPYLLEIANTGEIGEIELDGQEEFDTKMELLMLYVLLTDGTIVDEKEFDGMKITKYLMETVKFMERQSTRLVQHQIISLMALRTIFERQKDCSQLETGVLKNLMELFYDKRDETDLCYQILMIFELILRRRKNGKYDDVLDFLIKFLQNEFATMHQKISHQILFLFEVFAQNSSHHQEKIKKWKFLFWNKEWIFALQEEDSLSPFSPPVHSQYDAVQWNLHDIDSDYSDSDV